MSANKVDGANKESFFEHVVCKQVCLNTVFVLVLNTVFNIHILCQMSVSTCDLFEGRAFQYGPACAIAAGTRRVLAYYPLGSGKTLSSLHGARTFLDSFPEGNIVVMTTLSNVETTWKSAIKMYRKSTEDVHKRAFKNAKVHNSEWWFSQQNVKVAHYNSLLQHLSENGHSRQSTQAMSPGNLMLITENKAKRKAFRLELELPQRRLSMLQATLPAGPFCLIVDECQEYLNSSAKTELVNALASAAAVTILLSATPVHDSYRYNGLRRLLGKPVNMKRSILWTDFSEDMPTVFDSSLNTVELTVDEWRAHQAASGSRNSSGNSENAYLTKSRQVCNSVSKWTAMALQIESDIQTHIAPIRIVVYSFFLGQGVDGFFNFLQTRWSCAVKNKRLSHRLGDSVVKCSKMEDKTLKWFNNESTKVKILLLTSKSGVGISLHNVRWFHLMEPQWTDAEDQQAIGRATRKGSHTSVEPEVNVFRWVSTYPGRSLTAGERVRMQMLDKKKRTDILLDKIARCGDKFLAEVLNKFDRS